MGKLDWSRTQTIRPEEKNRFSSAGPATEKQMALIRTLCAELDHPVVTPGNSRAASAWITQLREKRRVVRRREQDRTDASTAAHGDPGS